MVQSEGKERDVEDDEGGELPQQHGKLVQAGLG